MISNTIISFLFIALVFSSAKGATIPSAVELDTCIDLCSSCDGIAEYKEDNCECSISANVDDGTECLSRMKRQAQDIGLDIVSCNTDVESRSTRCALGSRHAYGKSDIDRVAKYFMQDGPMTGSVFIAPPYTHQAVPVVAQMVAQPMSDQIVDCDASYTLGSPHNIITQPVSIMPADTNVGAPNLITQPKEFMPADSAPDDAVPKATLGAPKSLSTLTLSRAPLGISQIAPQFLSFLGEMISKPLIGLPDAIRSIGRTPGVHQLALAPSNFLNSLADQMTTNDQVAKANLDNFRDVVGKAQEQAQNDLKNLNEAAKAAVTPASSPTTGSPMQSQPSYSIVNPHPMLSWLNPTVGAPAPTQFIGAQTPMQFVGATQLVSTGVPSQLVGASQMVASPAPGNSNCVQSQMVGSPTPSFNNQQQILGAAAPSMLSTVPMYHSLGTIPLSSIVSQVSPTYLLGAPMTYYPAMQTVGENHVESLEEIPLSSPPQKKICKKSTMDQPSMKYTRDITAIQGDMEQPEVKIKQTTTTTTEVAMIDRTTTQKPKEKTKENKSFIGKIKPLSKNKADKKIAEHKL